MSDVVSQKILWETYRASYLNGLPCPDWKNVGFRCYSQNEEDGYLLYIFSLIGLTSRRVVEICCGSGDECNTANLILNHRCIGLLFEGNAELAERAIAFYKSQVDSGLWPPRVLNEWIVVSNINDLIRQNGFVGDVDLLSLDVDGVDYWLWKEITVISPRVVVLEVNHLWGPDMSVTVPYADDFKAIFTEHGSDYAGASVAAFVKLSRAKGYRLVGANSFATNIFLVRNDIEHPWLPEVTTASLFWHPRTEFGRTIRYEGIKDMRWEEV